MKLILALLISISALFGQGWPSTGLIAQWYGTNSSGVSGGALTDLSGNGHSATLHGTAQVATGTTCNGSSDYASFSALLQNSNYTIIVFASSSTYTGIFYSEDDSSPTVDIHMAAGANSGGGSTTLNGGTNYTFAGFTLPNYSIDWHAYYYQRSNSTLTWGVIDENLYQTKNIGNVTSLATTLGGLCAQVFGSGVNSYWTGTFGPVGVYNIALNQTNLQLAYAAGRAQLLAKGAYMRDLITSAYPSKIYQRQGTVLSASGGVANEKALYTTTDCQLVSNPCFQMWFDNGSVGVKYAESSDGKTNWTIGSATLVANGSCSSSGCQPGIIKNTADNTYLLTTAAPSSTGLNIYKSAANVPNSFTLSASGIVTASGLSWSSINNSFMAANGGTLYLAFDGYLGTGQGVCGGATSTDGSTWTPVAGNPISGYGGTAFNGSLDSCSWPDLHFLNGGWIMWEGNYPYIFRRQSTSFNSVFQRSSPSGFSAKGISLPIFTANAPDESSQMANPSHLEVNGITYMYYTAADASNNLHVKLAIANMPISQLVVTGEGMATDVP